MVAKNDITGDSIQSRTVSNTYRDNYDLIFGKKKPVNEAEEKITRNNEETQEALGVTKTEREV